MLVPIGSKKHPNLFMQIDEEDFHLLRGKTPCYCKGYALIAIKSKSYRVSRLIMNAPKGILVDHINHDPLDNRRCNLRLCTRSQNQANRYKSIAINNKPTHSKYKGVSKAKFGIRVWRTTMRINGKSTYIGAYHTEIEAAMAYDKLAKMYHGEFALLNFPHFKG